MKNNQKGFASIVALIVVIVAIIAGGTYFLIKQKAQAPTTNLEVGLPSGQPVTSTSLNFAKPSTPVPPGSPGGDGDVAITSGDLVPPGSPGGDADVDTSGSSIKIISPSASSRWIIGQEHTIKLGKEILANLTNGFSVGVQLVDTSGKFVGLINCTNFGPVKDIKWDTKTLMNFCGAATYGKYKDVIPGVYRIKITFGDIVEGISDEFNLVK